MKDHAILFLDVDGVLNRIGTKERTPWGSFGIQKDKCKLIQKILNKTPAFIVVSSTWRYHPEALKYLLRELGPNAAIRYLGKTPVLDQKQESGLYTAVEIQAWLNKHPEVTNYVILDDDSDGMTGKLAARHIKTNMATGLTEQQTDQAIRMLNGEE